MSDKPLTPFNDWVSFIHDESAKVRRDDKFEAAMDYAEWETQQDAEAEQNENDEAEGCT